MQPEDLLVDPWAIPEFRTGLAAGAVVAVALCVTAVGLRRLAPRWSCRLGGIGFLIAGLWSLDRGGPLPMETVVGCVGVAAATGTAARFRLPGWVGIGASLPFAWLIGFHTGLPDLLWFRALVIGAASLGAGLVAAADESWRDEAAGPGLFAITVAGAYLAVPDTEEVAALLGVALPLAALGWPIRAVALGRSGAAGATALLFWAAAVGSRGRPAALIGAVTCLGLLGGLPVGRLLAPRAGRALRRAPRWTVVLLAALAQVGLVVAAARGAGLRADETEAVALAAPVALVALMIGAALPPPQRPLDVRSRTG